MPYGEIITRSAKLVWKFKILWLFGLLASCAAGNGANLGYNFNAADFSSSRGGLPTPFLNFYQNLEQFVRQTPFYFFTLLFLFICGLGVLLWLIGIFGRSGLYRGAWQADSGAEHLGLSPLASEGAHSFWRVAGLTLLVGLPGLAVGLVFVLFFFFGILTLFARESSGIAIILICLTVPMVCFLVPLFWLLGILSELCTVAVVGEGRGVFDGIKRGWNLFKRNFGQVILAALIVLVAQIAFGILVGILFAPIGLGALFGGLLFGNNPNFSFGLLLLFGLIALPISLFVSALFHAYLGTFWTLVFRRLTAAETPPAAPLPLTPVSYPTMPDPII